MEYNELINTEVIWIPKIPKHWELIKVRHLFKESTIKGFPNEPQLVASQEHGVVNKGVFGKRTMEATKDFHLLKLVEEGDFVISLRSFQGGIELAHQRGIISPAYTILKEKQLINKRYFKHLFKSKPFISLMTLCVKGIRDGQNIDFPTFKGEYLPVPPIGEQERIGLYLDRKTQQIQEFIAKKERLVELLEEEKQSLINKLVIQGIDKNIVFKETDLGLIPEHWDIRRLGTLGRFYKGGNISREELTTLFVSDDDVSAILYGDIYTKYNIEVTTVINKVSKKTAVRSVKLNKGDLLFTGSGETKEDIGKCVLFNSDLETFAGGDVIIFKQRQVDGLFLSYSQNSNLAKYQRYLSAKGEIIIHTYGSLLRNVYMPFPPSIEEQKQITTYIKNECLKIDNAISKAQTEIEKAKEYQESLITQVVTGQLKVPCDRDVTKRENQHAKTL